MPGAPDPAYVLARRALLDGLKALRPHLDSLTVIGAQAVYIHTGSAGLAVAELTTDADIAIAPTLLADQPELGKLLEAGRFRLKAGDPGRWESAEGTQVDLLVPEALAGGGRRGARLGPHGKRAARRAKGIEAALVDRDMRIIGALDESDDRSFEVAVAGPAALVVAKMHKIAERSESMDRLVDKDALDLLRLLQTTPTEGLAAALDRLEDSDLAGDVTVEALGFLKTLAAKPGDPIPEMATRAAAGLEDPQVVADSLVLLTADLMEALSRP